MLTTISMQMMTNYQGFQDQLILNDLKLTTELQWAIQDSESFKQELHKELNTL